MAEHRRTLEGRWPGGRALVWTIVVATVVGAVLRLGLLDTTIGFDEAVTVRRFVQGGPPAIFGVYSGYGSPNNHVVNSLLAWLAADTFGLEVWALRLPAFVFSVLIVPLVGVLGWLLTGDRTTSAVATLMATVSPILVGYGPACRGYAALVFFALVSVVLLVRALERFRPVEGLLLALAVFATGWSHMTGLVFAGTCGLTVLVLLACSRWRPELVSRRTDAVGALVAVGLGALAIVAWYSRGRLILEDVGLKVVTGEFDDPALSGVKSVIQAGFWAWISMISRHFLGTDGPAWLGLWLPVVGLGAHNAYRWNRRGGVVLFLGVLVPPLAFLAARLQPIPRYFLFVQPLVLLMAAAGTTGIGRMVVHALLRDREVSPNLPRLAAGVLGLVVAATALPRLVWELRAAGASYMGIVWNVQGAVEHVAERVREDDVVLAFPRLSGGDWVERAFWQSYRFHEQARLAPLLAGSRAGVSGAGPSGGELDEPRERRVWYISPLSTLRESEHEVLPDTLELEPHASFKNCFVFLGSIRTRTARHAIGPGTLVPTFERWTRYDPFEGAVFELGAGTSGEDAGSASVAALRTGAVGEFVSPGVPVESGCVVVLEVRATARQGAGLRPFALVSLRFQDGEGNELEELSTMPLQWAHGRVSSEPFDVRLATVSPRGARSLRVRLGLAEGNQTGDVLTYRLPTLTIEFP